MTDGVGVTHEELRAMLVHQRYVITGMLGTLTIAVGYVGMVASGSLEPGVIALCGLLLWAASVLRCAGMEDHPFANRILARFGWPNETKLPEVEK